MDNENIRQILLTQRETLLARVERTHKHIHKREEPVSQVFSEQSVEMESQQLIYALDADGRNELKKIDRALQRLDAGNYGICVGCRETISTERLMAIPSAEHCIHCASED